MPGRHKLYKNTGCGFAFVAQPARSTFRHRARPFAMRELTARQQEILSLVRQHIHNTGFPPTRAEIAAQLGFRSPNAAEEHLKALARKGVLELTSGASRGIRLKMLPDSRATAPSAVQIALSLPL